MNVYYVKLAINDYCERRDEKIAVKATHATVGAGIGAGLGAAAGNELAVLAKRNSINPVMRNAVNARSSMKGLYGEFWENMLGAKNFKKVKRLPAIGAGLGAAIGLSVAAMRERNKSKAANS